MTYETALSLFYVLTVPAIALLGYKLYSLSRRNAKQDLNGSPFSYEIDRSTGEIIFADESSSTVAEPFSTEELKTKLEDSDVTMVDVLAPEDDQLAELASKEKILEETET